MPAVWDETRWAIFGVYLREDHWKLKDAVQVVNCSDTAIKQAYRVRQHGHPVVWPLLVTGQVTVGDAWALVKGVERRFKDNPKLQQKCHQAAVRWFQEGKIDRLAEYLDVVTIPRNG